MYRLVIVDDEKIVIQGIQVLLKRENIPCEVVGTASDGRQALSVIEKTRPDVVITDIRIPYVDGLSLIESCEEFLPDTDYIIISGYQEFSYARKALILGALDYIDKPVTKEKLAAAFERLEARRKGRARCRMPSKGSGANPQNEESSHNPQETGNDTDQAAGTRSRTFSNAAITRCLTYIQENYTRDIGLTELSDLVEMNPAYLSVLFKETVGTSFVKYLTRLRITKAKELLKAGMKASEVAAAVGYNDAHYFYETFKKNTGKTPSEYRAEVKKQ